MNLRFIPYLIFLLLFGDQPAWAQMSWVDFSVIDRSAREAPSTLERDLPALTAYLIENTETELEKTRAIYVWIIAHINYDEQAAERNKRSNRSLDDVLRRKKALCMGYAQLFREMCRLAGIEAFVINGYVRDLEAGGEMLEEPNHSWNAALLAGKWYLFDPTWGHGSREGIHFPGNDPYFAAPPKSLIKTHLPGNPMWQLLAHPLPTPAFMAADSLMYHHLQLPDSSYAYFDSLQLFMTLSPDQQRLHEAEYTYRTHPTPGNRTQFGHALIDYAGILADTVELLQSGREVKRLRQLNGTVIRLCRQAVELVKCYPWQEELYINALINQAVVLYNKHSELEMAPDAAAEEALLLLKEALSVIEVSEGSLFNQMARQQCEQYIQVIE